MSAPFDQQAKLMMDADARAVLAMFGDLPLGEEAVVEQLDREVTLGTKRVDHIFRVTRAGRTMIEHFEVTTAFRHAGLDEIFDRSLLLEVKHQTGVRTRILLMTSQGMPEDPPARHVIDRGGSNVRIHKPEFVGVWKVPARQALELGLPEMLPWVPLMDATPGEEDEAIGRVSDDLELMTRMTLLYGLRYGKNKMIARFSPMFQITEEMMRESSATGLLCERIEERGVARGMQQGRQEGRQQGLEQGRTRASRDILRAILEAKFGGLPAWATARIESATAEQVLSWGPAAVSAATIEGALP